MKLRILQTKKEPSQILVDLDKIFIKDGVIQPVSIAVIDSLDKDELRIYCHFKGIYAIISPELCRFLNDLIGEDSIIEIGSGNGTLALAMEVNATDNKMQQWEAIALQYTLMGQKTIQYPRFVEELDGIAAINKYKPKVVLGAWITHKWRESEPEREGNSWAPDEEGIMALCDRYIMVGNEEIHQRNRLLTHKYNVIKHKPDCLRSRAKYPEKDVVFEFSKK